mgnify:CR=1 FL=1
MGRREGLTEFCGRESGEGAVHMGGQVDDVRVCVAGACVSVCVCVSVSVCVCACVYVRAWVGWWVMVRGGWVGGGTSSVDFLRLLLLCSTAIMRPRSRSA